jgi:CMP-N-acetylneuraminic acid synthetase
MFFNKKILVLVPARGGSEGIKFKDLWKSKKILHFNVSKFINIFKFFDDNFFRKSQIK